MSFVYFFMSLIISILPIAIALYVAYRLLTRKKSNEEIADPYANLELPTNILWIVLTVVVAYNVLLHDAVIGLGSALLFATSIVVLYLAIPKVRRDAFVNLTLLLGVLSSLMIGVRANGGRCSYAI